LRLAEEAEDLERDDDDDEPEPEREPERERECEEEEEDDEAEAERRFFLARAFLARGLEEDVLELLPDLLLELLDEPESEPEPDELSEPELLLLLLLEPLPPLLLVLLPLPLDEDEPEPDEEEEDDDEEEESALSVGGTGTGACAAARFGAFLRCSRKLSVSPPRPIAVQKLMAKRVFLAESVGKSPWKEASAAGSLRRSLNCFRPRYSATSWKSTLMKMRDDEVVSASVMTMYSKTPHGNASEWTRWPKNFAMLRSLLVSRRWIIAYCLAKVSSKAAAYAAEIMQKRSPSEP